MLQRSPHETETACGGEREEPENQSRHPAAVRRFLETDLERRQRASKQRECTPIEPARFTKIRLFDRQKPRRDDDRDQARRHVDEKQPVPGIGLGDPAADERPDGRRKNGENAGDGGSDALGSERKEPKNRGEYRRNQKAAGKSLNDPRRNQRGQTTARLAGERGDRKRRDPAHE